jgi:hypothetical protein
VPVNAGLAFGANKFNAFWVAVDTGLLASDVLLTLPSPTIVAVIPFTVPVKVAPLRLALPAKVVLKSTPFNDIVGVDKDLPLPMIILPENDWSVVAVLDAYVDDAVALVKYDPRVVLRLDDVT